MKRILSMFILASAILAGCTDTNTPTAYIKPDRPDHPDTTKTDTTKTDTTIAPAPYPDNAIPKGQVNAPYLLVTYYNGVTEQFMLEKYQLDGKARQLLIDSSFSVKYPAALPDFSATADRMVYVNKDSFLLVEFASLRSTLITVFEKEWFGFLTLSSTGSKLVFPAWDDEWGLPDYYVLNVEAESAPVKLKMPFGDAYLAAISRDERKIAFDLDGAVYVSDINGDNRIRISDLQAGFTRSDYFPIFNKDGDKVIFYSSGNMNTDLVIAPVKENATNEAVRIVSLSTIGKSSTYQYVLSDDGKDLYLAFPGLIGSGGIIFDIYKVPVSGGPFVKVMSALGDKNWQLAGIHFVER
jgi:Tol biopolymer transport system component